MKRRKFWGWGNEGEGPNDEQARGIGRMLAERFGIDEVHVAPEPRIKDIVLPKPRISPPSALAGICSQQPFDRAGHTYGKSFRDIVRGVRGDFDCAPDFVAFPTGEEEIAALLDWCNQAGVAAIPYGGGTSVCGGVEARVGDGFAGAI